MIGVDTNVLVRILVEDDRAQLQRARAVLDEAAERSEKVFVSDIVLAELHWVLEDAYEVPRSKILQAIQGLVASARFEFEDTDRVNEALSLYQGGKAELSDYLLGLQASRRGARTTFTFDRALRDDVHFTLS